MKAKLFGLLLLCAPLSVNAFGYSGEQLKEHCDVQLKTEVYSTGAYHLTACSFYVGGFLDGVYGKTAKLVYKGKLPGGTRAYEFCWPDKVTNQQIVLVVAKYLKDHPEDLHLRASALIYSAIDDAWPCK